MMNKPKSARQLLLAFNKDKKDQATRAAIMAEFGQTACFAIKDGQLDVDETLENRIFMQETQQEIDGAMTFTDVTMQLAPVYEADPLTGLALRKGVTTDRYRVDWSEVPEDLRLVVAYAVVTGQVPAGTTSETVVEALLQDPLRAPWTRLAGEWNQLSTSKRPADQQKILDVRNRLLFDTSQKLATAPKKFIPPEIQKLVDLGVPKKPLVTPDQLGGRTREYVEMEEWALALNQAQYHAVLVYILAPSEPWGNLFQGGKSRQAEHLYGMMNGRVNYRDRIETLFALLEQAYTA